ncbi:hypothetical protein AMR77_25455 [Escherichia coli]|uniref:Envelope glycoprotein N n=1 Tax=Bovine alphaherpesvirus 2 TaxID=10295 RepID=A0A7T1L7M3_9ALPH|nr:hypothetical protein AMR77_25455 [Escherichia coli]QPO25260.1 envelope glycoprotein N [Bovine alphaherpesvirus 2]
MVVACVGVVFGADGGAVLAETAHGRDVFWEERCVRGPMYHSPVSGALLLFYLGLGAMGVSIAAHAYGLCRQMFCLKARADDYSRMSDN